MAKTKEKLTEIQARALVVLRDHGPLLASGVGAKVWPDRKFKNAQGEGFAGGCLMGKLRQRELVNGKYERWGGELQYMGWALTAKGGRVLAEHEADIE